MTDPLPDHPIEAELDSLDARWVVQIRRALRHPVSEVWSAVTDPDQVALWAPFQPDRPLDALGPIGLLMLGGSDQPDEPSDGVVTVVEPPSLVEFTWGGDIVRIELAPESGGTLLTLRHTFDDRDFGPRLAAGWHITLQALDGRLDGRDVPRVAGADAKTHGWDELNEQYSRLLADG